MKVGITTATAINQGLADLLVNGTWSAAALIEVLALRQGPSPALGFAAPFPRRDR